MLTTELNLIFSIPSLHHWSKAERYPACISPAWAHWTTGLKRWEKWKKLVRKVVHLQYLEAMWSCLRVPTVPFQNRAALLASVKLYLSIQPCHLVVSLVRKSPDPSVKSWAFFKLSTCSLETQINLTVPRIELFCEFWREYFCIWA